MANDYLLKIDGIPGESMDSKHKGAIDIESFSWGATNAGSYGTGGGGGAGKVSFQDLHFTAGVNKSSPKLMQFCATGEHIKKATVIIRKQGEKQQEFYKIELEDLLVSSYQSGGSEGSELPPVDQFSLNFAKIKFEYAPQKDDQSLDAPVTATWNIKTNSK